MLTPAEARVDVAQLVTDLLRHGLAVDTNAVVARTVGTQTVVGWSGVVGPPGSFGTIAEYQRVLRTRQYTCVLYDGSLLQLTYTFERQDLAKHRLAFIPCPVVLDAEDDVFGEDLVAEVEAYLSVELDPDRQLPHAAELSRPRRAVRAGGLRSAAGQAMGAGEGGSQLHSADDRVREEGREDARRDGWAGPADDAGTRLRLRPWVRFDYDPGAGGPGHPASHLHVLGEHSRWPTFGPLSTGHFARFVFEHYYPRDWADCAFLREWPRRWGSRCVTGDDEQHLFLDWRRA